MNTRKIISMDYGDSTVLIECVDTAVSEMGDGTAPSGLLNEVSDKLPKNIFVELGMLAKKVGDDFRSGLDTWDNLPKEVELEFNFAITTTGKLLVLSAESEMGIKLKLKWKN